jgi:hypothetical protein
MNNYKELYDLIVKSFLADGYEIYKQCDWLTTVRRWKLVHATEDLKVLETTVNIIHDETEGAEQILVRYSYYEKD